MTTSWDMQEALDLVGHDRHLLRAVIETYLQTEQIYLNRLRCSLDAPAESRRAAAHTFRGAAATVCGAALVEQLLRLEQAASEKSDDYLGLLCQIEKSADVLRSELRNFA